MIDSDAREAKPLERRIHCMVAWRRQRSSTGQPLGLNLRRAGQRTLDDQ